MNLETCEKWLLAVTVCCYFNQSQNIAAHCTTLSATYSTGGTYSYLLPSPSTSLLYPNPNYSKLNSFNNSF